MNNTPKIIHNWLVIKSWTIGIREEKQLRFSHIWFIYVPFPTYLLPAHPAYRRAWHTEKRPTVY